MPKVDKAFEGAEENAEVVETPVVEETEHQEAPQVEQPEAQQETPQEVPQETSPEIGEPHFEEPSTNIKKNDHVIYKTSTGERYVKVTSVVDDNITFIGDEGHEVVKRVSDVEKAE